jgi:hypothetical protein
LRRRGRLVIYQRDVVLDRRDDRPGAGETGASADRDDGDKQRDGDEDWGERSQTRWRKRIHLEALLEH